MAIIGNIPNIFRQTHQLLPNQVVRFFDIMDEAKVGRVGFTEFHNFVEAAVQVEPGASQFVTGIGWKNGETGEIDLFIDL